MAETEEFYSFMYAEFTKEKITEDLNFITKLEFWESKLKQFCESRKKSTFSTKETYTEFTHKNLIPTPFNKIMQYLICQGKIRADFSMRALNSSYNSLTDFICNKIYNLLSVTRQNITENTLYFYLPYLEKLCLDIHDKFSREQLGSPFDNIITFNVLSNMCSRWGYQLCASEISGIIAYLQESDFISVKHVDNETYIKFIQQKGDVITNVDIEACHFKALIIKEKGGLLNLNTEYENCKKQLMALKTKGTQTQERLFTLEERLHLLETSILTSHVIGVSVRSTEILKQFKISEKDLNSLYETEPNIDALNDIVQSMKIASKSATSDSELEKELEELIYHEAVKSLPEVPSKTPKNEEINNLPKGRIQF
ncbi:hypothetical protein HZS_2623 [Henneguya salminicola]|nr:hypothetical protein HZS_2623 [Henneguya salminicola]